MHHVTRFLPLLAALLLLCAVPACGQTHADGFTRSAIDDALFQRIRGKSYKDGCNITLSELEYLQVLHYDADGHVLRGELICNRAISEDLLEIFEALYQARYPIESLRLIDDFDADDERSMEANNSSCFNYRTVSGRQTLSAHSRGMAIDINPLYNPYVRTVNGKRHVEPQSGQSYVDRTRTFPFKIDRTDLCYRQFIAHGFQWGGSWKSCKDYQHFEKKITGAIE